MIRVFDFSRTRTSLRPLTIAIPTSVGRMSFRFHFNIRATRDPREPALENEGAWFFELSDVTGTILLRSRRVTVCPDLLATHRADPRLPPGVLRCTGNADPQARCLGLGLCTLVYEEPD